MRKFYINIKSSKFVKEEMSILWIEEMQQGKTVTKTLEELTALEDD